MIKSKFLNKFKNISHGFFNSEGGHSKGLYKSLNCGIGSKDKKRNVLLNLKKAAKRIETSRDNLILLKQIHSNRVFFINKNSKYKKTGDGLITNKPNLALGILTADCAPILIFDPKNSGSGPLTYPLSSTPLGYLIKNEFDGMINESAKSFEQSDKMFMQIQNLQYRVSIEFKKKPISER